MTVAEFLIKRVQEYGWLSVGHIFCDNGYTVNPFTSDICASPAEQLIFVGATYDSTDTANLEKYVVGNPQYAGMQKTIACVGFEHVQHFDMNLFNQEIAWTKISQDMYPMPAIPAPSVLESITLDPETGLADDHTTAQRLDKGKIAVYDLYPDMDILNTSGLRIKAYQDFQKRHKLYVEAIKKFTGISDCI